MSFRFTLPSRFLSTVWTVLCIGLLNSSFAAEAPTKPVPHPNGVYKPSGIALKEQPIVIPPPPTLDAQSYILIDATSGKVLVEKNSNTRMAPASLTKIMTAYILFDALKTGQVKMTDQVQISTKAWRTGGSRMFVQAGSLVNIEDLLQGIVVQSGNDACVAVSEHLAGSEESFTHIMNQQAANLGMTNTHFTDSTGLPDPNHHSSAADLAKLARAMIAHYPEYYHYFSQKWFTYNKIKQNNRNRLLWLDPRVDGLKTGFTDDAGYCLAAAAKQNNMRLISIVLGSSSPNQRTEQTEQLLNYGFSFYDTYTIYSAGKTLVNPRTWGGQQKNTAFGIAHDIIITIPKNEYKNLQTSLSLKNEIEPPIVKGQQYGKVTVTLNGEKIAEQPLIALHDNPKGGVWRRFKDYSAKTYQSWTSDDEEAAAK